MKYYTGDSESFHSISDGFEEYGFEVALRRVFPDLVDGFKPVYRRILYIFNQKKIYQPIGSNKAMGYVQAIHPHDLGAAYAAACKMSESNGTYGIPLTISDGNVGKNYVKDGQAAQRYTYLGISPLAVELLMQELDGIEYKDTETDNGVEPVRFSPLIPMGLVGSKNGIAVGISNKILPYNPIEVVKLTKEYIKDGCEFNGQILYPDFSTGGKVIADNAEMLKIMVKGEGTVKSRSNITVDGKDIIITEPSYLRTDDGIVNAIKALIADNSNKEKAGYRQFPYVANPDLVRVSSSYDGFEVRITCKNKHYTEDVINILLRKGILQTKTSVNMLYTYEGRVVRKGVYGVISAWFEDRKKTLTRTFNLRLDKLDKEFVDYNYFIKLIDNDEYKQTYLKTISQKGKEEAGNYLKSIFEEITDDSINWISKRGVSSFHNGGKYRERHSEILREIDYYKNALSDLNTFIYNQLDEFENKYKDTLVRKTEISFKDYKFSKKEDIIEVDDSYRAYIVFNNHTILKTTTPEGYLDHPTALFSFHAKANSHFYILDNTGRIINVYGEDLNDGFTEISDYIGVTVNDTSKWRLLHAQLVDGTSRMLIYSDGNVSFIDSNDLVAKKLKKRVNNKRVPLEVATSIVDIVNPDDLKDYLIVADDTRMKGFGLGVAKVSDIIRKSISARTRVFSGKDIKIRQWGTLSESETVNKFIDINKYTGRLRFVKLEDTNLSGEEFVEGSYNSYTDEANSWVN